MRSLSIAPVLVISMGLSGCATIASGTHSSTYLETSPENARCQLVGRKFTAFDLPH